MENKELLDQLKKFAVLIESSTSKISELLTAGTSTNLWLFGSEVKDILRISESTLRRMRLDKRIPYKKIGRTYYYPSHYLGEILLYEILKRFRDDLDDDQE